LTSSENALYNKRFLKKEDSILYAIFQSGGKQYLVEEGTKVCVEKLELQAGETFSTDQVLLVRTDTATLIGTPLVVGASITGKVLGTSADDKILVFKKKRRKQYRKTTGHRQRHSEIQIEKIVAP
jgi:large subunit ribosomal protein L21